MQSETYDLWWGGLIHWVQVGLNLNWFEDSKWRDVNQRCERKSRSFLIRFLVAECTRYIYKMFLVELWMRWFHVMETRWSRHRENCNELYLQFSASLFQSVMNFSISSCPLVIVLPFLAEFLICNGIVWNPNSRKRTSLIVYPSSSKRGCTVVILIVIHFGATISM